MVLNYFNMEELQLKTNKQVRDLLDNGDYINAFSCLADYLAEVDLKNLEDLKARELEVEFRGVF